MPIIENEKNILKRIQNIRKLLKPIVKRDISAYPKTNNMEILYSAFEQSKTTSDYRATRFRTKNPDYEGNYFERWTKVKINKWKLTQAYLTIYYDNKEIVALHCNPDISTKDPIYKYKSGPHIHVNHSNSNISKAHIALNLSNIDAVTENFDDFEKAISNAVIMIKDEIIERL
jgi:hypothetical protein